MTALTNNLLKVLILCMTALAIMLPPSMAASASTLAQPPFQKVADYDETLQGQPGTAYEEVKALFLAKGGTYIRLTPYDEEGAVKTFMPLAGDALYPLCTAGKCRSQTLWTLLKPYEEKIVLFPPHATRQGFDPYNGRENWRIVRHKEMLTDEFGLWAGHDKAVRFGFDVFAAWLERQDIPSHELEAMSDFYSTYYFGPDSSWQSRHGQRRVYLAFAQNNHVIMHRLNRCNESLDNVVVVHIPLPDLITNPPVQWDTTPRSRVSYANYAEIIRPLFDFSAVR